MYINKCINLNINLNIKITSSSVKKNFIKKNTEIVLCALSLTNSPDYSSGYILPDTRRELLTNQNGCYGYSDARPGD